MTWLLLAASVILTWDDPTVNEDGTPLTDLAIIKVYQRTFDQAFDFSSSVANIQPGVQTYQIDNLTEGHYVFVVQACDDVDNCSYASNEAGKVIIIPPNAPSGLIVQ